MIAIAGLGLKGYCQFRKNALFARRGSVRVTQIFGQLSTHIILAEGEG